MPYNKQTWANGPSGGTPMSAGRLGHIEDGIAAVEAEAIAALALAADAIPSSAGGVTIATLDPTTHVLPDNQIPAGIARDTEVATAVAALVAAAPSLLDTLKELADALGDDPNFATTMTNALATKASVTALNAEIATARAAEGTRLNFRGAWAALTPYVLNDAVSYNGGFYRAPNGFTTGASFVLANWHEITPQSGTYIRAIFYGAGPYPARTTITSVATDPVDWYGPVMPTVGGTGMGVNDTYHRTTS